MGKNKLNRHKNEKQFQQFLSKTKVFIVIGIGRCKCSFNILLIVFISSETLLLCFSKDNDQEFIINCNILLTNH